MGKWVAPIPTLQVLCLFTGESDLPQRQRGMIADTHRELAEASHLLPPGPTSLSQDPMCSLGPGGGRVASSLPAWAWVLE